MAVDGEIRVLYVDDEPNLCRAFARMFASESDVHVSTSTSPVEATDLIEREAFDVIVADLRMPVMNGLEFLAAARSRRPDARRMLVSGFADLDTALDAINRVGVDRLLTKPWNNYELQSAVRAAAERAALLRENHAITEELRRKSAALHAMNVELDRLVWERTNNLISGLVSALDLRDSETQWHSRRVGRYARKLAEHLGISGKDLDDIERGSILHDIGKIGVSDAVLLKPGPLDDKEWIEMKRHPMLGYEILKGIKFLDAAALIPLHHQERWDGSGYPAGLKRDEICFGARVFGVVDAFDAITSDRPYRKASDFAFARHEIERQAGTVFDPNVVKAFLEIPEGDWRRIRGEVENDTDE